MRKPIQLTCLSLLLSATTLPANAATDITSENSANNLQAEISRVQIEWQDPTSYSDVRAANQSRKHFREKTFNRLEKHLEKLASKLPDGQTLKLSVTDLDLAGRVWPGSFMGLNTAGDVRIVKRVDFPSMQFSYTLVDAQNSVIKTGEEKLRDLSFQDRANRHFRSDALRYEKRMLDDWFGKTFKD